MAARGWLPSPMHGIFFGRIFFDGNERFFNRFIENPKLHALLHYKFMSYKFLNLHTCPIPDIEKKTLGAYMIFYMAILRVQYI